MSNTTPILSARWSRATQPADRWQALQTQLSAQTVSAASHWTRRSFLSCKWRVLPAGVSAPSHGMV